MNTFISLDVETGNLDPWSPDGVLLSVGAVVVHYEPCCAPMLGKEFYVRIDQTDELDGWWWDHDELDEAPHPTAAWWQQQNDAAKNEAWLDRNLVRHSQEIAARLLVEWVETVRRSDDITFVANPVSFDKMWIDHMFAVEKVPNPFHYRSLCLRSMRYGLQVHQQYGSARETHQPVIPHHPLHDAHAQALDLCDLIRTRDGMNWLGDPGQG